jgi:hypothetical protein
MLSKWSIYDNNILEIVNNATRDLKKIEIIRKISKD